VSTPALGGTCLDHVKSLERSGLEIIKLVENCADLRPPFPLAVGGDQVDLVGRRKDVNRQLPALVTVFALAAGLGERLLRSCQRVQPAEAAF